MTDLFDKKWVHQILKALLSTGAMRYSELKRRLKGVSPKTLVERLRDLEEYGIVERTVYPEVPIRVEYRLTERGVELARIIEVPRIGVQTLRRANLYPTAGAETEPKWAA
jgi:DNA-binding HxlR family transcriptional regulator